MRCTSALASTCGSTTPNHLFHPLLRLMLPGPENSSQRMVLGSDYSELRLSGGNRTTLSVTHHIIHRDAGAFDFWPATTVDDVSAHRLLSPQQHICPILCRLPHGVHCTL